LDLEVIIIVSKMARQGEVVEEMTVSAKGLKQREAGRYFFSPVITGTSAVQRRTSNKPNPRPSSDERCVA
jgi:hypothetical protein